MKKMTLLLALAAAEVEPDDNESAVRLLSYADRFEIEAVITTIGWNCDPSPTVQQTRSPEELKALLHKFRLYTITDQDMVAYSSHQWLRREFPDEDAPELVNATTPKVSFTVPGTPGRQYHLICEVRDDDPFHLVTYRRIILKVE